MRSPSCVCAPQELVPWAPAGTNHSIWIRLSHDRTRAQRVHGQGARCRGGGSALARLVHSPLLLPWLRKRLQSDKKFTVGLALRTCHALHPPDAWLARGEESKDQRLSRGGRGRRRGRGPRQATLPRVPSAVCQPAFAEKPHLQLAAALDSGGGGRRAGRWRIPPLKLALAFAVARQVTSPTVDVSA